MLVGSYAGTKAQATPWCLATERVSSMGRVGFELKEPVFIDIILVLLAVLDGAGHCERPRICRKSTRNINCCLLQRAGFKAVLAKK